MLLSMGKEHLYVWEMDENMVHENEAAERLYKICANENIYPSKEVKEGKIEAFASVDGYFQIDVDRLDEINSIGDIMIATRHSGTAVKAGDKLAGMRVIPLIVEMCIRDSAYIMYVFIIMYKLFNKPVLHT